MIVFKNSKIKFKIIYYSFTIVWNLYLELSAEDLYEKCGPRNLFLS